MNDFSVSSSCGPFQLAEVPPFSVSAISVLSCPPNVFLRAPANDGDTRARMETSSFWGRQSQLIAADLPLTKNLGCKNLRYYLSILKRKNVLG